MQRAQRKQDQDLICKIFFQESFVLGVFAALRETFCNLQINMLIYKRAGQ